MKFSEERPNDGDTIEALFPDGEWYRVEYSSSGIDGLLLWNHNSVTELDDCPDMQWRPIEGEDMSDLLTGLPDKNEDETVTLRMHSNEPEKLKEFLGQFSVAISLVDDSFFVETSAEIAPYLVQHIELLGLGWGIEVVEAKNGD